MGKTASLGELVRREGLLASLLAVCAVVIAGGVALRLPQLSAVGAVVAVAGSLVKAVLEHESMKVERRQETVKARRHLLTPVVAVAEIDPTEIGVDPAVQVVLPGGQVVLPGGQRPEYVGRSKDAELSEALSAAVTEDGPRVVVVRGPSKVGKSRSMFEALLRAVGDGWSPVLVAPVDGAAVTALLTPGEEPTVDADQAVLWLDDLEPFLNSGVTLRTLNEWNAVADGRVVVATYGGKGSSQVADEWGSALTSTAQEVLQHAAVVTLAETTEGEVKGLRGQLSSRDIAAVEEHGLAAFLVAGELLEGKLNDRRHDAGEPESPGGVACVHAAIDWARCGRTDPIPILVLRGLWASRCLGTEQGAFDLALQWALKPVAGSIALLTKIADGIEPFDYVVRLVAQNPEIPAPTDEYWEAAINTAESDMALDVGRRSYEQNRLEYALKAFRKAARSDSPRTAAIGGYNVGVVFGKLGRSDEAIGAFETLVAQNGDDPTLAIREQVAMAMVTMGDMLGDLSQPNAAIEIYDEVITRYSDDTAQPIREQVAKALTAKAITLWGRWYGELLALSRDDTEPAIPEQVAKAPTSVDWSSPVKHLEEATAVSSEIVSRYSDDTEPTMREQVSGALFRTAFSLAVLGRSAEAIVLYDKMIGQYSDNTEQPILELAVVERNRLSALQVETGPTSDTGG